MTAIYEIDIDTWHPTHDEGIRQSAVDALENGQVVLMPNLNFDMNDDEVALLSPDIVERHAKNICYDSRKKTLHGTGLQGKANQVLYKMMQRYADYTHALVSSILPYDMSQIEQARTSFRPVEVLGRPSSYRKDDTRLHVDAFPSTPMYGKRILRVFNNVNPNNQARVWRVGEPFEDVVKRFLPNIKPPLPYSASILNAIKATRGKRSKYDHYMMRIHNAMKADTDYQKNAKQIEVQFQPGSTWMVFTDNVSHAAMTGQYLFEQSFYLPVSAMVDEARSPLRVLEKVLQQPLV